MNRGIFKNIEWWVLIFAIILCVIGFVALYSTTQSTDFDDFKKQIIWFVISIVVMIAITFIDYRVLVKISPILYGISILLLVIVLFTKARNGASSWFNIGAFSLQPAELTKVSVLTFLTYVITKIQFKGKEEINRIFKLAIIISVVALPVLLIIMQPDFGTATTYLVALIMILFVAGIDKKYIIIAGIVVIIGIPLAYQFLLPEHAKSRSIFKS